MVITCLKSFRAVAKCYLMKLETINCSQKRQQLSWKRIFNFSVSLSIISSNLWLSTNVAIKSNQSLVWLGKRNIKIWGYFFMHSQDDIRYSQNRAFVLWNILLKIRKEKWTGPTIKFWSRTWYNTLPDYRITLNSSQHHVWIFHSDPLHGVNMPILGKLRKNEYNIMSSEGW